MKTVEVVYALENQQTQLSVEVTDQATVEEAIIESKVLELHPEIDLQKQAVGIFSQKVALTDVVQDGDRIEIYRPLKQDPKARRLQKANPGSG